MRRTRARLGLGPAAADDSESRRRKGSGGSNFNWLSDNDSDAEEATKKGGSFGALHHAAASLTASKSVTLEHRDDGVGDSGPAGAQERANQLAVMAAVGKLRPHERNGAHDDSALKGARSDASLNGEATAERSQLVCTQSAPAQVPDMQVGTKKPPSRELVRSDTWAKQRWQRAWAMVREANGNSNSSGNARKAACSRGGEAHRAVSRKYVRGESRVGWVRNQLRARLESPRFESATLSLVLLYGVLVLTDLGLDGLELRGWNAFFRVFDIAFLFFFMLESLTRLVIIGPSYLQSPLDLVDFLAILLSFLMMVALDLVQIISAEDIGGASALLLMVRFLRVFRLAAVMMRSMKTVANVAEHEEESHMAQETEDDAERHHSTQQRLGICAEARSASHRWHHELLSRARARPVSWLAHLTAPCPCSLSGHAANQPEALRQRQQVVEPE